MVAGLCILSKMNLVTSGFGKHAATLNSVILKVYQAIWK